RAPGDPLGLMGVETSIVEGTGSQTPSLGRWGDYNSMSVDPTDDCTMWYTNEYLKTNGKFNWSTRIASFKFTTCQSGQGPILTVNGSGAGITVAGGAIVNVGVQNGPGLPSDCVLLSKTGTPESSYVDWFYLSGSKNTLSPWGTTSATLPFTMPSSPGTYEFRFLPSCS